ncbi:hypothetical protein L6452_25206 [Arctium lappa]|uniref:Uncharacterized protein n=1 Tax=Arctium lappa TaxID=4217 RepID=A0ACB9AB17_ARCLA|nr:hypothetical protein L6452_25206 [Arctium lappa]
MKKRGRDEEEGRFRATKRRLALIYSWRWSLRPIYSPTDVANFFTESSIPNYFTDFQSLLFTAIALEISFSYRNFKTKEKINEP